MLQIFIKGQQVDLLGDTEVAITIEHPMLSNDHIPVPYSVDIDLPLTAKNRIVFGFDQVVRLHSNLCLLKFSLMGCKLRLVKLRLLKLKKQ